eukprot:m.66140 g.66140  ORF g.66140 m.66140 type:complete len:710 (+) comp12103_c0_seq2:11-2140(+)
MVSRVAGEVDKLLTRFDKCVGERRPRNVCTGDAVLAFAKGDNHPVHFEARQHSVKTEVMIRRVEKEALPFVTFQVVGETTKPVKLFTVAAVGELLKELKVSVEAMSSVPESDEMAQVIVSSNVETVRKACSTIEQRLEMFEAAILRRTSEDSVDDAGKAASATNLDKATEHAASINTTLSQYPEIEEVLHPSVAETAWGKKHSQYLKFTLSQLRTRTEKLYQALTTSFAKLTAKSQDYAISKRKQEVLDALKMQLSETVKHKLVLETFARQKVLYEVDVSVPLSVVDLEHSVLPQIDSALSIVHALQGTVGFKSLVEVERIIMDVQRVVDNAVLSDELKAFPCNPDEPPLLPIHEQDVTPSTDCGSIILQLASLIDLIGEMMREYAAFLAQGAKQSVPTIALDSNGCFHCDTPDQRRKVRDIGWLTLDPIDAPVDTFCAKACTLKTVQDIEDLLSATTPLLAAFRALAGPNMTIYVVKHYNRLFPIIDWLKGSNYFDKRTISERQLKLLTEQLNGFTKPFSSTMLAWEYTEVAVAASAAPSFAKLPSIDDVKQRFMKKFGAWVAWEDNEWALVAKGVNADGVQLIAEALMVNTHVKRLNLWKNALGDEGAKALAEGLKINKSLAELDLERAKIGVAGAKALAACLKCNRTLTGLSLSRNSIGLEGALAFAQALKVNSKLSWLNLQNNNLPSEGKRKLRSAQRASFQLDM